MEALIIIIISYIGGIISQMLKNSLKKDDGTVILTEDRCEVIFKDPYDQLIKKKKVLLKMNRN